MADAPVVLETPDGTRENWVVHCRSYQGLRDRFENHPYYKLVEVKNSTADFHTEPYAMEGITPGSKL